LRLTPIETVPTSAHQQAFWGPAGTGGSGDGDERARRALARVQTLLGHGSVLTPVVDGGRDPLERTRLVPWGDEPVPTRSPEQPWPGQLPAPAPTVLLDPPRPAQLLDDAGRTVVVTPRGAVPRPPARFSFAGQPPVAITSWAGPWPLDERWWSPQARHVVRCQLVDVHGRAYLVSGTMPSPAPPSPAPPSPAPPSPAMPSPAMPSPALPPSPGLPRWQVDAIYD
jgi:protein ImuB